MKSGLFLLLALLIASIGDAQPQATTGYDTLVRDGNAQLQAGNSSQALEFGQRAIKVTPDRWQAYALVGGALMNLKRYEEAADNLSRAIDRAPTTKQSGLRELRKQCVMAETGVPAPAGQPPIASQPQVTSTSQAEIVLWKSIESSASRSDFEGYLKQYPDGIFATLAHGRIDQFQKEEGTRAEQQAAEAEVARRNAIVGVKVEHDHDAGVGNLFTAGATIGQCYGELDLGRHTIIYKTGGSHAFSASCSEMSDLELKSKYGKNNMVHMVVNGKKYNFFSHDDPHSAQDIIDLIHNTCNSN